MNTTAAGSAVSDPFIQLESASNVRNIAKIRNFMSGARSTMSVIVEPTEDYVYQEQNMRVQQVSNDALDAASGYQPRNFFDAPGVTAPIDSMRTVRRRKFRWSKLWTRAVVGSNIVAVFNDDKFAHGFQIMVQAGSYSASTFPYLGVEIRASIEFKHDQGWGAIGDVTASSGYLFPYTYAGGNSN